MCTCAVIVLCLTDSVHALLLRVCIDPGLQGIRTQGHLDTQSRRLTSHVGL